ncbi:uncharacterized protein SAPINGB_P003032 [Magnusiomyces paraingens]|uniref:N-acetylgalactosaminide beta-1,3-galactosyltransferase n=1 Tax=Magnusiomyces paraingens TaxID=2606893 RepID=A0A5E8BHW1_9ASCO|nr:uncharacterized protein SAPINGB_P003032 [Saprochaete ingens]VVT51244.1 unnamed protein product [Saprochaete ingens]
MLLEAMSSGRYYDAYTNFHPNPYGSPVSQVKNMSNIGQYINNPDTPVFPAFYRTPMDVEEATTLAGQPLYDQAQPGGADWRSILRDIQEKRRLLREKENMRDKKTLYEQPLENTNPTIKDETSKDTENIQGPTVAKRASAALLNKIKTRRRSITSAQQAAQKFGQFKRQFLTSRSFFHEYPENNRFESDESWRPTEVFPDSPVVLRQTYDSSVVLGAAAAAVAEAGADVAAIPAYFPGQLSSAQLRRKRDEAESKALHPETSKSAFFAKPFKSWDHELQQEARGEKFQPRPAGAGQQILKSQDEEEQLAVETQKDQYRHYGTPEKGFSPENNNNNNNNNNQKKKKVGLSHEKQREMQQQILNSKVSRSQHMQQYLANDFGEGTERIFLLMKTGRSVQWERLPTHFFTTFTRFPNFAIYSDAASSMAGYEIIDILQDLPMEVLKDRQLGLYVEQQKMRRDHTYADGIRKDERPWIMDKFKNIPMLQHAWRHAPDNDWYVLVDDDTYILSDNLGQWLATLDPNKPYYLGSAVAGLQHIFAHGGSGIILSRGVMEMAFGHDKTDEWVDEYSSRALRECCGDYMLAAFLKEKLDVGLNLSVSGKRFQGEDFTLAAFNKQNWCSDIVSFHHVTPRSIELLWEYERIRGYAAHARAGHVFSPQDGLQAHQARTISYGDLYTDFVKPYLLPMRDMWDNGAKEVEFSWARDVLSGHANVDDYLRNDGNSDKAYTSVDKCRQACLARADCLMFRYDPYQKYCGFAASVSFGHPRTSYQDNEVRRLLKQHGIVQPPRTKDDAMHSEWRLDRIEAMRTKIACDPPPENQDYDDGREGWYWRAREQSSDSLLDQFK